MSPFHNMSREQLIEKCEMYRDLVSNKNRALTKAYGRAEEQTAVIGALRQQVAELGKQIGRLEAERA